ELVRDFHRSLHSVRRQLACGAAILREELARRQGLSVVRGTVQIPDLRIEYEAPVGGPARVDLELATTNYGPTQLAAKALAGFTLYAPASDIVRLHGVVERHDLMIEILSL